MFKKLISNLAISPSSIDQVSFYARRLKQEQAIRRIGLVLIIFSMCIQIFAAMVPPEKSFASSNDVISGGVDNIGQLSATYNSKDHKDVKALYNRFGIDSSNLKVKSGVKNVTFNFKEQGADGTRTVGRINFASTKDHNLGQFAGKTFYSRSASEWSGSAPAYYFGKQKATDGGYYEVWILKDCGNIAYKSVDAPKKKTPTPKKPTVVPTVTPKTVVPETKPQETPTPTPTPTPEPTPEPTPTPTPEAVCDNNPKLKADDVLCECPENPDITADDENCTTPLRTKAAHNLTQKLNAEKTTTVKAKAGDVIEYTLTTKNTNIAPKKDYIVEDQISDVLEYAEVDTAFLGSKGGQFDAATKKVSWPAQTIKAKGQVTETFRVKLKATIPSTNKANESSPEYDCIIQNGYGNETKIPVECSVLKTVEKLPNTGPGTTIAIGFTVSALAGYFFMRGRLLAKELGIVKKSYQSGF